MKQPLKETHLYVLNVVLHRNDANIYIISTCHCMSSVYTTHVSGRSFKPKRKQNTYYIKYS